MPVTAPSPITKVGSVIAETDAAVETSRVTVTVLSTAATVELASETGTSPPASRTPSSERSVAVPFILLSKVMAKSLSNVW